MMSGPDLAQVVSNANSEGLTTFSEGEYGSVSSVAVKKYNGDVVIDTQITKYKITPRIVAAAIPESAIVAKCAELIFNRNSKPKGGTSERIFSKDTLSEVDQNVLEIDLEKDDNFSLDTDFLQKTENRDIENEVTVVLVEHQDEIFLLAKALENGEFNNLRQIIIPKGVINVIPPVLEAYVVEVGEDVNYELETSEEDLLSLSDMSFSLPETPIENVITVEPIQERSIREIPIYSYEVLEHAIKEIVENGSKDTLVLNENLVDSVPLIENLLDAKDISYELTKTDTGEIKISILDEVAEKIETKATISIPLAETSTNIETPIAKQNALTQSNLEAMINSLESNINDNRIAA